MNESFTMIARICFQSVVSQFSIRHTDSRANFTAAGGFAIDLTSDSWDFLMPLTATQNQKITTGEYRENFFVLIIAFISLSLSISAGSHLDLNLAEEEETTEKRKFNIPVWASITAGSTCAKSAITNLRFSSILTVCSANCFWIS